MICCLFRYSTDVGTSSCLWSFNPLLLRLLGEISLSLLCSYSSRGSALDLDPPLRVGRLRASVLRSHRTGLKEQLLPGLWLTQAWGKGGVRMRGEPAAAEASVMLQQPGHAVRSPREVVPGSWDSGSGGLHSLLGGEVWTVTCART